MVAQPDKNRQSSRLPADRACRIRGSLCGLYAPAARSASKLYPAVSTCCARRHPGLLCTCWGIAVAAEALVGGAAPDRGTSNSLTIAALGVVYGDIGTSPLYAVRQSLLAFGDTGEHAILGALSLIFWSLVLVVTLKYVAVIMRADNRGEGGLLALTALVLRTTGRDKKRYLWIMWAGLVGAALFYGDGVITPAISVLSAVEGLKVATPLFDPYVIPISLVLLF